MGAQAANVAFLSDSYSLASIQPDLPAGHTYTAVTVNDIDNGSLSSYDALLLGHVYTITATTCTQIQTFLNAGKGLVSEWSGATLLFPQTGSLYYPVNISCALFSGSVTGGDSSFGSDIPVTLAQPASPLVSGLSNPFSMQGGSEFVYLISGYGAEWEVAGTSDLGGTVYPTVLAAKYGGRGCVALSPFDYFDSLSAGSNSQVLLGNLLNSVVNTQAGCGGQAAPATAVPVPTLSDTMLWLLSALVLLAAAPVVQRRMRS